MGIILIILIINKIGWFMYYKQIKSILADFLVFSSCIAFIIVGIFGYSAYLDSNDFIFKYGQYKNFLNHANKSKKGFAINGEVFTKVTEINIEIVKHRENKDNFFIGIFFFDEVASLDLLEMIK